MPSGIANATRLQNLIVALNFHQDEEDDSVLKLILKRLDPDRAFRKEIMATILQCALKADLPHRNGVSVMDGRTFKALKSNMFWQEGNPNQEQQKAWLTQDVMPGDKLKDLIADCIRSAKTVSEGDAEKFGDFETVLARLSARFYVNPDEEAKNDLAGELKDRIQQFEKNGENAVANLMKKLPGFCDHPMILDLPPSDKASDKGNDTEAASDASETSDVDGSGDQALEKEKSVAQSVGNTTEQDGAAVGLQKAMQLKEVYGDSKKSPNTAGRLVLEYLQVALEDVSAADLITDIFILVKMVKANLLYYSTWTAIMMTAPYFAAYATAVGLALRENFFVGHTCKNFLGMLFFSPLCLIYFIAVDVVYMLKAVVYDTPLLLLWKPAKACARACGYFKTQQTTNPIHM